MKGRATISAKTLVAIIVALVIVGVWAFIDAEKIQGTIDWMTGLPVVLSFVLAIAFWGLFALAVWWAIELLITKRTSDTNQDNVNRLVTIVTALYAFVLGFVVYQEWNNVSSVRDDLAQAAAALYAVDLSAQDLPGDSGAKVGVAGDRFVSAVLCKEFPELRATGQGSKAAGTALDSLLRSVTSLPPKAQASPVFGEVIDGVETASQSRRQWLSASATGLPTAILAIIFLVAAILVTAFIVQSTQERWAQGMTILGLVVFVGLGTGLVISLNKPFAGAATVGTETFVQEAQRRGITCPSDGATVSWVFESRRDRRASLTAHKALDN